MDDLLVRSVQSENVDALANFMCDLGYPTLSEEMYRSFEAISADPSYATLIAARGGKVLGMVGLHLERLYESNGSCARIIALVVG